MTCPVCEVAEKGSSGLLHRDERAVILYAAQAGLGHIRVHPVRHATTVGALDEAEMLHLYSLANLASTVLYEGLGAQGTNILLNEGDSHLAVDIIARAPDDGLNFQWVPKQIAPNEMSDVQAAIKDKILMGAAPKPEAPPIDIKGAPQELQQERPQNTNYLLKHLRRLP